MAFQLIKQWIYLLKISFRFLALSTFLSFIRFLHSLIFLIFFYYFSLFFFVRVIWYTNITNSLTSFAKRRQFFVYCFFFLYCMSTNDGENPRKGVILFKLLPGVVLNFKLIIRYPPKFLLFFFMFARRVRIKKGRICIISIWRCEYKEKRHQRNASDSTKKSAFAKNLHHVIICHYLWAISFAFFRLRNLTIWVVIICIKTGTIELK